MGKRTLESGATDPLNLKGRRNAVPGQAHPGSHSFTEARDHLPAGPSSLRDAFKWHYQFADDTTNPDSVDCRARVMCLRNNLRKGVIVFSDHSGTGNGERSICLALGAFHDMCPPTHPKIWCSVDPSPSAQIALSAGYRTGAAHIFNDIMEQIPPDVAAEINRMMPDDKMEPPQRRKKFEDMWEFMKTNMERVLPDDRVMKDIQTGHAAPPFVQHFPNDDFTEPLTIHVLGTECYAFAFMGSGAKTSHDNFATFLMWCLSILRTRPLVVIHEITELHPEGILEYLFKDTCPPYMYTYIYIDIPLSLSSSHAFSLEGGARQVHHCRLQGFAVDVRPASATAEEVHSHAAERRLRVVGVARRVRAAVQQEGRDEVRGSFLRPRRATAGRVVGDREAEEQGAHG
eukprot:7264766-Pyramimonas_sp.AAC.1